jgi:hypothetical protein
MPVRLLLEDVSGPLFTFCMGSQEYPARIGKVIPSVYIHEHGTLPRSQHGVAIMAAEQNRVMGPVDYLIVQFPGNRFSGKIAPELARLERNGIIRVLDLVFLMKDETGKLVNVEAKDLEGEVGTAFREVARRTAEWFSEADIEFFAQDLPANSSAGLLLVEHLWAVRFKEALLDAGAELIDMGRVPPESIAKAGETMSGEGGD